MTWADHAARARDRILGILNTEDSSYYRQSAPETAIPLRLVHAALEENKDTGISEVGTYQDSPHVLIDLAELGFTPLKGDEVEVNGDKQSIYKVLLDGEGGATLWLGDFRG